MTISIKRVYEPAAESDGKRILIDRLWPRGLTMTEAKIDLRLKEVAPSAELRKWFGRDPDKWVGFQRKYRAELRGNTALAELKAMARTDRITLLFAARDEIHSHGSRGQ